MVKNRDFCSCLFGGLRFWSGHSIPYQCAKVQRKSDISKSFCNKLLFSLHLCRILSWFMPVSIHIHASGGLFMQVLSYNCKTV